jgi:hypothetical protein
MGIKNSLGVLISFLLESIGYYGTSRFCSVLLISCVFHCSRMSVGFVDFSRLILCRNLWVV